MSQPAVKFHRLRNTWQELQHHLSWHTEQIILLYIDFPEINKLPANNI
jgi:hypothetical protein